MTDVLIPDTGDFDAWEKSHDVVLAVDWDGTCKDTMVPKWTRGFNWALTEIWPALKSHQDVIDATCYRVNMVDDTAGVQRFVALMIMMREWKTMGLPVPDLERFFDAVETVERTREKHGVATYRKYQARFGYDDSPLRWSDRSDAIIAESTRDAEVFANCRDVLEGVRDRADLIVVSASKTEAVRDDLVNDGFTHVFRALCAQDFLPKRETLEGLRRRYDRVLFVGDTKQDVSAAKDAGVPVYLVHVGDEAASWARAERVFDRFINGDDDLDEIIHP